VNARWIRLGPLAAQDFDIAVVRLASAQRAEAKPILAWARDDEHFLFALIAPRRLAPGRSMRWLPWGIAPAIAAYRQMGLRAYIEGDGIWLHGEPLDAVSVREIRECVVVASRILARLPSVQLEDMFRLRLEAQHGWQFDHSWPMAHERVDYALA
jgi:hypothetical protein